MKLSLRFGSAPALGAAGLALALACGAMVACDDDNEPFYGDGGAGTGGGVAGQGGGVAGQGGGQAGRDGGAAGAGGTGTDAAAGSGGSAGDGGVGDGAVAPMPTRDMVVVRLNADGTRDNGFGTNGVARIDLGTADMLYDIDVDAQNRIVLFASARTTAANRSDIDRVIARLTKDGAVDTAFATNGFYALDIAGLNDEVRNGFVQADGKILSSGYTSQPTGVGTQSTNRVVLVRLGDDGKPDNTFGVKGVVNSAPFMSGSPTVEWGMAEAYGAVAQQGGAYVTTGYGWSMPQTTVDLVSFRYSATGAFDTNWGTAGIVKFDLAGQHDRGRNLVALADDRILMVGSISKAENNLDAAVWIYGPNGAKDAFNNNDGYKLYDLTSTDEAFFGVARKDNLVAAVGYRKAGDNNDDATLLLLPVTGAGVDTATAKAVPVSATTNDRFWTVAFDGNGKVVAAGYVTEASDNWFVAARFNADGTPDTNFGTGGVAKVNVTAAGGTLEMARGVAIQTDGKIVLGGVAEH